MNISVNCPSYKRPKVRTLSYLPFCKVWVCETEYEDYIYNNKGYEKNIVSCTRGIQGNVCRIRNHILRTEFENGADVVVIVDDDMKYMAYFESVGRFGYNDIRLETEDFLPFVEEYSLMATDLGAFLWGVNLNYNKDAYNHYTPFSTNNVVLGPFSCHIRGGGIWYDERLPLKEDYDICIQHLNRYRVILRVNKYHYYCKQSEQDGGCATYRNMDREREQLELLRKKWGSEIIATDKRMRGGVAVDVLDYNPIVRVPIKGV